MAQKVLVLGDSGTGKSASMRNFKPEEVLVINSAGKPLPFKNHFETVTPTFNMLTRDVLKAMDSTNKKVIVIDDAQYIMSFQYMRRIKENGWDKWNDIQGDFFNIIMHCDELPNDVIVYFLSHIQRDDEGHEKIKTMGKMLDEKITIEGLFSIVLKTAVKDGQYFFFTQNSGLDTVKSPIGMFPTYAIDNDLKYVDEKIRNYYEIGDYKDDEEIAKADQEVAKPDVEKTETPSRKRRKASTETAVQEIATVNDVRNDAEQPVRRRKAAEIAQVDKGTGTIVGATIEELKAEEKAAEQPVRRRKSRTEAETPKVEESTAEAEKPLETAVNEPQNVETPEAPKRRRRKANKLTPEDMTTDHALDLSDDDLPF